MGTKVVTFLFKQGKEFAVNTFLDWAKKPDNDQKKSSEQLQKLIDSAGKKILERIAELQRTTEEVAALTKQANDKIDSFRTEFEARSDFGNQLEDVKAVRRLLEDVLYDLKAGATDLNENLILDAAETAKDFGKLLNRMNQCLTVRHAEDARSLWDNYLHWFETKLQDHTSDYSVKSFNEDINALLTAFSTLHLQATVLFGYYQSCGRTRPAKPDIAMQRIADEATTHIQGWNDKIMKYYEEHPGIRFLLQEMENQTERSTGALSVLVVQPSSMLTTALEEPHKSLGWSSHEINWHNRNQHWNFTYLKSKDRWEVRTRNTLHFRQWGVEVYIDAKGNLTSTANDAADWKIIPLNDLSDKPQFSRMNIKVSVVSRTVQPMTNVYLDYVIPLVPDAAEELIFRDVESWARKNASSRPGAGAATFPFDKWAFCKVQIGLDKPDSDLVLIRAKEGDRVLSWEYAASSNHPFYMAGTSRDIMDEKYFERDDNNQYRADITAECWAYFDIYAVPEVFDKSKEETRTLLSEGHMTTFRNQCVRFTSPRTPLASIYIRIEDDWDKNRKDLWVALSPKASAERVPSFWRDEPHMKQLPQGGTTRTSIGLQEGSCEVLVVFEWIKAHTAKVTLVRWPHGKTIAEVTRGMPV